MKVSAALVTGMLAAFHAQHPDVTPAIKAAIDATLKDRKVQDAAKADKESAWKSWLNAGQTLADAGADKELASMLIQESAGKDELTVKSVNTYVSRVSSLVPILAMNDEQFAELWDKAGIDSDEGPTKQFHNQIAAKLIKAYADRAPTARDRLNATLKAITAHVKALATPELPEGLEASEVKARKADALKLAQEAADVCFEALGLDASILPIVSSDASEEGEAADADDSTEQTQRKVA